MVKQPPDTSESQTIIVESEHERIAVEAMLRTMRDTKARLKQARDPKSSREAYSAIFRQTDRVAQMVVAAAEEELSDEEDDRVDVGNTTWVSAGSYSKTYHSTRGPIIVKRKLYRSERNGPTRCFYDERRGIIGGGDKRRCPVVSAA